MSPGAREGLENHPRRVIVGWGSSSMALIGPALDVTLSPYGITFVNEGQGGETSHHTAARIGAIPVPIRPVGGLVPSAGTVQLEPTGLDLVAPFLKPFAGQFELEGTGDATVISGVVHGEETGVHFTRSLPGPAVPARGAAFVPTVGMALRGTDALLWMGKNDVNRGAEAPEVIDRISTSVQWLRAAGARVAVVGQFVNNDATSRERSAILEINVACARLYGDLYIDVQDFLVSPDLPAAGGTPASPEDLAERSAGAKPPSLSRDPGHFNQHGNQVLAHRIADHLAAAGWFDPLP